MTLRLVLGYQPHQCQRDEESLRSCYPFTGEKLRLRENGSPKSVGKLKQNEAPGSLALRSLLGQSASGLGVVWVGLGELMSLAGSDLWSGNCLGLLGLSTEAWGSEPKGGDMGEKAGEEGKRVGEEKERWLRGD